MSEPLILKRQRQLVRDLADLIEQRANAQPEMEARFRERQKAAEREFQQGEQQVKGRLQEELSSAENQIAAERTRIQADYDRDHEVIQGEISNRRQRTNVEYLGKKQSIKSDFQEARWTINAVYEGNKNRAEEEWKEAQEQVAEHRRQIQVLHLEAEKIMQPWRTDGGTDLASLVSALDDAPVLTAKTIPDDLARAAQLRDSLVLEVLPSFYQNRRNLWLCVLAIPLALAPLLLFIEWYFYAVAVLAGVSLTAGFGKLVLSARTRRSLAEVYVPLCQTLAQTARLCNLFLKRMEKNYRRGLLKSKKQQQQDMKKAQQKYLRGRKGNQLRRDSEWKETEDRLRDQWAIIRQRRDHDTDRAESEYQRGLKEARQHYELQWRQVQEKFQRLMHSYDQDRSTAWSTLEKQWKDGMERIAQEIERIQQEDHTLFPAWDDPAWNTWQPAVNIPSSIRFGDYLLRPADIGPQLSDDERLRTHHPAEYLLPACLTFPNRCSLLFKANDEGRARAVESLQTIMLRFLTALPPGKVRFTIIDPVGLGQNFAAFMHLADYDEALVASRIWTELPHIEQRLADLTGHMENVIQKYLRNQFQSIEEYNENAGEVAEPYRVLVVANFPVNFSVEASRRLVSIVSSGARCGVYALITVDTKQPLPQGFNLADLEQPSLNLAWENSHVVWKDPDFEKFPLRLDDPPKDEFCTRLMHQVGARAKDASRVEVPFEFIAPPVEKYWTSDSRGGIYVPLGRAGATKRQHLHLGIGTAHHVLIAGKTGSGKSTLLHALITNLALHYSPDEVELYLVDFKKGVEFKTYATHELPHARVVAVESEREFGLSVLQRLDTELKHRGDRFREVGAQNLAAFRQTNGKEIMPRILLIVDEFQEFFIEDDKISQEAAQLLDRLVRQGRAFGLHVLLGSQTLGGAYSLARSTIDQMAVRIALQCSEADGHIILSDDNSAARLHSRPGEAIYNDANGLVEGNNPFQVVWLADDIRETYLERIHALDKRSQRRSQIVFEGNAPADAGKNLLLNELLRGSAPPTPRRGTYAWLGEAMAIKDPTAAIFRSQSGSNLLIVGQHEVPALGILTTSLISLAAQVPWTSVFVLDGSPEDSPHSGTFASLAEKLARPFRLGGWRDTPAIIGDLAGEVERRQQANQVDGPELYLLIYGLQRFRDLRKPDDDFSFSRKEEKPNAAKLFATILRDGPPLGVHTLVWCDSLNNVNRCFDRQGLREFEMRVLFQMSATDSSVLIDNPIAGKLGLHRALFHSEDQGKLEKFRPYGLPAKEFLDGVRETMKKQEAVAMT